MPRCPFQFLKGALVSVWKLTIPVVQCYFNENPRTSFNFYKTFALPLMVHHSSPAANLCRPIASRYFPLTRLYTTIAHSPSNLEKRVDFLTYKICSITLVPSQFANIHLCSSLKVCFEKVKKMCCSLNQYLWVPASYDKC